MIGKEKYDSIDIGDLISWKVLSDFGKKNFGIVLDKFVIKKKNRETYLLKVADSKNNTIKNILAVIVKIENKFTT